MKVSKNSVFVALSVVLGAFLMYVVLKLNPPLQVLSAFSNVTPIYLFAYFVISVTILAALSLRWKILVNAQGYKGIPFLNLASYRIVDYGVSYMTPIAKLGGEPVRAAMLMRHGIGFKEGLVTVTIDKMIEMSLTFLFFVFGCFLLIFEYHPPVAYSFLLVVVAGVFISLVYLFYSRILRGESIFVALFVMLRLDRFKLTSKYKRVFEEFERPIITFYKEKRKEYLLAFGVSFIAFILSLVEYGLLLLMLGVKPSLSMIFLVFSVIGIAFVIPVPMGLGSLEAFQAWLFLSLGLNPASGVGLAMMTRARDFLWVLVAFAMAIGYGSLKIVLDQAYNSKYSNPVVRMAVFRSGKAKYFSIKLFRTKSTDYVPLQSLRLSHPWTKNKYPKEKK